MKRKLDEKNAHDWFKKVLRRVEAAHKKASKSMLVLGALVVVACGGCVTVPDVITDNIPTPNGGSVTTPADPAVPTPVTIAHGNATHVPMQHKDNRPRGTEQIRRIGPFNDFRTLEVGDDAFLDGFIMSAVRVVDGYIVGDDLAIDGVVYVFDHWSIKTSKDKTVTNPLKLDGVSTSTFRAWWRCYEAAK
jgi:hypothetical protein